MGELKNIQDNEKIRFRQMSPEPIFDLWQNELYQKGNVRITNAENLKRLQDKGKLTTEMNHEFIQGIVPVEQHSDTKAKYFLLFPILNKALYIFKISKICIVWIFESLFHLFGWMTDYV